MPTRRRASASRPSGSRSIIPNFLDKLEWRNAGPFRGGRVGAVAGDPRDRNTFYMGSTGGGVWKTGDGGLYWENMSDGFFKRASGSKKAPDRQELSRAVGELQRITATACFRQILNLLKTWEDMFGKFVQEQETEIRDKVRRLTDLDELA